MLSDQLENLFLPQRMRVCKKGKDRFRNCAGWMIMVMVVIFFLVFLSSHQIPFFIFWMTATKSPKRYTHALVPPQPDKVNFLLFVFFIEQLPPPTRIQQHQDGKGKESGQFNYSQAAWKHERVDKENGVGARKWNISGQLGFILLAWPSTESPLKHFTKKAKEKF